MELAMRTTHNVKDNGMLQLVAFPTKVRQHIAWSDGSYINKNDNVKITRKITRKIKEQ
jgi:hypothetical protein